MKPGLTSIILQCYDFTPLLRNITFLCLKCIRRYTPTGEYELIFIDNEPPLPVPDGHNVYRLDEAKMIVNKPDIGQCPSYIQGAKIAEGEYLCFMHNDVFVTPGWLEGLRYYLEKKILNCVYPDQFECTKEEHERRLAAPPEFKMDGARESGMIVVTREAYDACGGWDERFKSVYSDKAFLTRLTKNAHAAIGWAPKVFVHHIGAATYFTKPSAMPEKFERDQSNEGLIIREEY